MIIYLRSLNSRPSTSKAPRRSSGPTRRLLRGNQPVVEQTREWEHRRVDGVEVSSRRSYEGSITLMAWGAQILMSTQAGRRAISSGAAVRLRRLDHDRAPLARLEEEDRHLETGVLRTRRSRHAVALRAGPLYECKRITIRNIIGRRVAGLALD